MSATTGRRIWQWPIAIAGLLALAVLVIVLTRAPPIERSAIGFDGLVRWLAASGVAAAGAPDPGNALHVVATFDGDLSGGVHSDGQESLFGTLAPRPMHSDVLERRIGNGDTLVIMPKWRGGVLDERRFHPDLLIPEDYLWFLDIDPSVVRMPADAFAAAIVREAETGVERGRATLYQPQVLSGGLAAECIPLWTLAEHGILLARCDDYRGHAPFHVLSDPDLLSNQGLALGDNTALALALIGEIAPGRPVFVDQTAEETVQAGPLVPGADHRERSLADLERLFRYPFSLAWTSVGLLALLCLWRGNVRFGPVRRESGGELRSKADAIRASGGLMRRAGGTGDLVLAHAQARLDHLAERLLGPSLGRAEAPGGGAAETRAGTAGAPLLRFLGARAPLLRTRLEASHHALVAANLTPAARIDALPPFEAVVQEILDEFGRASRPA